VRLRRFPDLDWPLLVLPLVPVVLFSPVLFGDWVFWHRDISLYWYPQAEAFVRLVAGGSFPLWNPYMSFGLPFLADPSAQILYPFTWLNLLLVPATFYKAYALFHVGAAGCGVYLLTRRWRLSRLAAFGAGATWMASGPLLVVVSHYHHLAGTAWLPWVLLALDVALASRTLAASLALGGVAAGQVLAGSGDLCLMTAFTAAGLVAVFLASGEGSAIERTRAVVGTALVAGPSAALFSAAQWLPTIAALPSGQRLGLDPAVRFYWSLHPLSLIDLLVPTFVNDLPVNDVARAALFEAREPLFACIYIGAGAAALVGVSLLLRWNRWTSFAAFGFAFSILAALGRHALLYPLLVRFTPLFLFRYPEKYVILAGFFWALLVGLALDGWMEVEPPDRKRRVWGAAVAGLLALLMLAASLWTLRAPAILLENLRLTGPVDLARVLDQSALKWARAGSLVGVVALLAWLRSRRTSRAGWTVALTLWVVLADLGSIGWRINPLAPRALMTDRPAVLDEITAGSRIWVSRKRSPEWLDDQVVRGPAGWERRWCWSAGLRDLAWPPTGARWGLLGSYDGDLTGLGPPLLNNLTLIMRNAGDSPLGKRILQLGGVDYVVTLDEWTSLGEATTFPSVFAEPIRVYRVPRTSQRYHIVHRTRVAVEPRSVEVLGDPSFDPATEIVVPPGARVLDTSSAQGPDSVQTLWRKGHGVGLSVDASAPGYVVALEAFDSGWRARVDGRPADIVRANVLFQAVPVEAGHHTVVLEYRPPAILWGAALSLTSVAVALALWRRGRFPGLPPDVATL
jgi:hypothetical protein